MKVIDSRTGTLRRKFAVCEHIFSVVMAIHGNKQTGPYWCIHSEIVETFYLALNFVIWKIVAFD